jgi:hypothetical protein
MKHFCILLFTLVLTGFTVSAQDHRNQIKQIAQLIADATVRGDFGSVLDHTYPKFVNAHGGKDSVLAAIKNGMEKMKAQGTPLEITNAIIGTPGAEVEIGETIYCILPETISLKMNGQIYDATSSLLALSLDKGQTWWFLDAGNPASLRKLLPDVDKLNIPLQTAPVLHSN